MSVTCHPLTNQRPPLCPIPGCSVSTRKTQIPGTHPRTSSTRILLNRGSTHEPSSLPHTLSPCPHPRQLRAREAPGRGWHLSLAQATSRLCVQHLLLASLSSQAGSGRLGPATRGSRVPAGCLLRVTHPRREHSILLTQESRSSEWVSPLTVAGVCAAAVEALGDVVEVLCKK